MRIDISVNARLNQVKSSSIVLSSQNDNQLNTWKLCRRFVMSKLVEHDRNIVDILAVGSTSLVRLTWQFNFPPSLSFLLLGFPRLLLLRCRRFCLSVAFSLDVVVEVI